MGRTACTEPQCLYKGALYLYFIFNLQEVMKVQRGSRDMAVLRVGGQRHASAGITRYALYRRLGGPQGPSG